MPICVSLPVKEPNVISPLQIMKELFLVSEELNLKGFYKFKPYSYEPCIFKVYHEARMLPITNNIITTNFLTIHGHSSPKNCFNL